MKTIFITALTLLSYTIVFSQDISESCEVTTPPVIDGKVDDWQGEWKTDPDNKFQYNVCNDVANLYVRIRTSDDMTQGKIGRFGFTLWLDPSDKKKRKLGLKYPSTIGRDFSSLMGNGEKQATDTRSHDEKRLEMKRELIKDTEVLELIGLAKENITSTRVGLMNGIEVIIVMDDTGAYLYEAKIPFKAFRLSKASIPVLGVGFETGKMTSTGGYSGGGQHQGGGGSGGGHRGGGGHGGGGHGAGAPQGSALHTEMTKETKLWLNYKLN